MSVYIIAEAGVNHNGDLDRALSLVDVAAAAHADAVKFQTFDPEELVAPDAPKADYQAAATGATESQLDMLRRLALRQADFEIIRDQCRMRGIDFLSTPFDVASLDFLVDRLDMHSIKIASGEIVNGPLLLRAARKRRRIILSTGMSTLDDIRIALSVIKYGRTNPSGYPSAVPDFPIKGDVDLAANVVLLHCTSEYPAPLDSVNLRAMATLRDTFGLPCGFSDHSRGIAIPIAAAAMGADIIEKHFTLDRSLPGPDHAASLVPDELSDMVQGVRDVSRALGTGEKKPTRAETDTAAVARRVLVAAQEIASGAKFTEANLAHRRATGGQSPMKYWRLLGHPAGRDYKRGDIIDE